MKNSPTSERLDLSNIRVAIKYGKPVYRVTFNAINSMYTILMVGLTICFICAVNDLISAIKIKVHFGYFINLVSAGDGNLIPILETIPALLFIIINVMQAYVIFKIFDPLNKQVIFNRILFILILIALFLIFLVFILIIVVMAEIYRPHTSVHDGLKDGMLAYSNNSLVKQQIDMLQIEFDCCGSKKYDEWYNITWYDTNFANKNMKDNTNGNTPFSCCSKLSLFPCIHHDIENTGTTYLYAPERNLSISTKGCYESLIKSKIQFGWAIILNLFVLSILEIATIILLRFIQTGHFSSDCAFDGTKLLYTIWLIGIYRGHTMAPDEAPEPPPVPPELMK